MRRYILFAFIFYAGFLTAQTDSLTLQNDTLIIHDTSYQYLKTHDYTINYVMFLGKMDTIINMNGKTFEMKDMQTRTYLVSYYNAKWLSKPVKVIYDNGKCHYAFTPYPEGMIRHFIEYYPNGNKKAEGNYCETRPDTKTGMWVYYLESGSVQKKKKHTLRRCNSQ